ncbi:hypothetical protein ACQFX9_23835 [Aliinostoc sp. HNIBRCY26]|uniref:hypothetical protein n=1 Tax=Aliinostoc sp. HNIBRCY26 TaxID=3418997 RepID=UPI003D07D4A7
MAIVYPLCLWLLLLFGPGLAAIALYYSLAVSWQLVLLGICILYGIFPLVIGWIGSILIQRFGCHHEKGVGISYKCPDNPQMEELVTGMVFLGAWGGIITIPSGILGCIGLIISIIYRSI